MKRQGGFTLIELVVVIVILGILAVTAAPKFLNLQSDARASSLQGLKGAMTGAAGIVYGKSAIDGVETLVNITGDGTVSASGVTIDYGYPTANVTGIGEAVVGLSDDWAVTSSSSATQPMTITYGFIDGTNTGCTVTYTEAVDANTPPVITAAGADAC